MTRPHHRLSPLLLPIGCALILMTAHSSASAPGARYELFPEQEEHWSTDHRTTSAYVLDKKDNRFWICTVRYNFNSEKDNSGDCQPLPVAVGRPSLTPDHESQPVLGSSLISDNLPLFWFIEPTTGDVQFCAPRHPGVCVRMKVPR
jgi:hypothetical protein